VSGGDRVLAPDENAISWQGRGAILAGDRGEGLAEFGGPVHPPTTVWNYRQTLVISLVLPSR
jgi:hypothetical protein